MSEYVYVVQISLTVTEICSIEGIFNFYRIGIISTGAYFYYTGAYFYYTGAYFCCTGDGVPILMCCFYLHIIIIA